jgi:GDP-4-dehydro-6-deoxy-D-mannose reductase
MKRVYMTGSSGFIGQRLTKDFAHAGFEIKEFAGDITSFESTKGYLDDITSDDIVIHLAGLSSTGECECDPHKAFDVNLTGTLNLLESLVRNDRKPEIIFASTAHVYARNSEPNPLREIDPLQPVNTYGRSKRYAELSLLDWAEKFDGRVRILRLFNHSHKSQAPDFFLPSLYKQAREALEQKRSRLECTIGNVDLYRDIGSLKDLSSAFLAVAQAQNLSAQEIFNVCSGHAKHLRTLSEKLFERMELAFDLKVNEHLIRPDEAKTIVGDCSLLQNKTAWRPNCVTEDDVIEGFLI